MTCASFQKKVRPVLSHSSNAWLLLARAIENLKVMRWFLSDILYKSEYHYPRIGLTWDLYEKIKCAPQTC